jgi:hypothetical protein
MSPDCGWWTGQSPQALETEGKAYHVRDDREFMYEPFLPQILREGHGEMEMR